jgi:signal transduction histidine kinase
MLTEYLDVIIRNAKRLQRLTEDILDIRRIESKSLDLKKESFNLSEMIVNAIAESDTQVAKEHKDTHLKSAPKKGTKCILGFTNDIVNWKIYYE